MVFELDAGPIYYQKEIPITTNDDFISIREKLISLAINLLSEKYLKDIINQKCIPKVQDEAKVTYASKILP
jgi:methionyl-tRNA formyltransferase